MSNPSLTRQRGSYPIQAWVDGACDPNPGSGGWGFKIKTKLQTTEGGGHESATTNNRMEMRAAIEALKKLRGLPGSVRIYTDSQYVKSGITAWIVKWKRKGWKTGNRDILNRDLWESLDSLVVERKTQGNLVDWVKVRGHSGVPGNERADTIAGAFSRRIPIHLRVEGLFIENVVKASKPFTPSTSALKEAKAIFDQFTLALASDSEETAFEIFRTYLSLTKDVGSVPKFEALYRDYRELIDCNYLDRMCEVAETVGRTDKVSCP